jgi:hypothetical protein
MDSSVISSDLCHLTKFVIIIISLWAGFGRNQSPVRRPVKLYTLILGTFLGVVCHCFPLPLDVPTFAARSLYVSIKASAPSSERWARMVRWFCRNEAFLHHLGIFDMQQICHTGQKALLPFRRKACWGFFRPKNPTASVGSEPAILDIRGPHANH